ncbi:MAG: hypothetical protein HQ507_01980 [Candidatus Marinimicrobia bacterium]|nr:hypothetical protein [Candidatus Neomarinimicrobiota bacterium]
MLNVSHHTLKLLAALVWYSGVFFLLSKGAELSNDAQELEPEKWGKTLAWMGGILVGIVKTRFIFLRSCRKNLARIDGLKAPKIWEFYRIQFFFFLGLMILTGGFLSRTAQGHHAYLVAVAMLDISIGTALLLSSQLFWKQGVFSFSKNSS